MNTGRKFKALAVITLFLFFVGSATSTIVINSEDWKDVHSGIEYAEENDRDAYFVRSSDAQGLFSILPTGEPIEIIQSEDEAYVSNLDSQLETRNYEVEEVREVNNANLELLNEGNEDFVVVEEGNPDASLPASSLSKNIDGRTIIVNEDNVDDVSNVLQDASGEVILVGSFSREVSDELEGLSTEDILNPNRFELSTQIAERIEDETDFDSIMLADGRAIETDIVMSENPVILSGTNLLPESVENYVISNDDIDTVTVIGSELTTVGESLRDEVEAEGRSISVFVKFGQARGDTDVQSLSFYPLPVGDFDLNIDSVDYDPESEQMYVTFSNFGSANLYKLSSIDIVDDSGSSIDSAGDSEPQFIGPESSATISYDVDLSVSEAEDAEAQFTTSYGGTPQTLDTYITSEEEGVFGPPYSVDVSVEELDDSSEIELRNIRYLSDVNRFSVEIENTGDTDANVEANLIDVIVSGQEMSFSTDEVSISPRDTETLYVSADLDRIDQQENEIVNVELNYGEEQGLHPNSLSVEEDFEVDTQSLTGQFASSPSAMAGVAVVLLIAVLAGVYALREKDSIQVLGE